MNNSPETDCNFDELTPSPGKQIATQVKLSSGKMISTYLYFPEQCSEGSEVPLLFFLHGRGERGDRFEELERVLEHGPPKLIDQGKQFPFLVVSPQQTTDNMWWTIDELLELIPLIENRFPVDPAQIYCTGLSMGGFACWELAAKLPGHFAAIVPVCGGGETEWGTDLAQTPAWAFHGSNDDVIPLARSQEMVDSIKEHNGDVKLTVYPEAGHDSWTETYDNPAVYDWLLSHRRK